MHPTTTNSLEGQLMENALLDHLNGTSLHILDILVFQNKSEDFFYPMNGETWWINSFHESRRSLVELHFSWVTFNQNSSSPSFYLASHHYSSRRQLQFRSTSVMSNPLFFQGSSFLKICCLGWRHIPFLKCVHNKRLRQSRNLINVQVTALSCGHDKEQPVLSTIESRFHCQKHPGYIPKQHSKHRAIIQDLLIKTNTCFCSQRLWH